MKRFNVRFMFVMSIVFIVGVSCSKEREITTEKLQKGEDGVVYVVGEEKPYTGKAVFEGEQKRREIAYKNGKLDGLASRWYSDGQKKSETNYKDGQYSGPYRTWYRDGQQEKEGSYKAGKEDGQWVFWYPGGQKQGEGNYEDGKRINQWTLWAPDGRKLETGVLTDNDGNAYQTIKIGNQWWMAENLRVTRYRNGDAIPKVTESTAWKNLRTGAWCNYDNNADHGKIYGLLYNWHAVNDRRSIAPEGWHVPADEEWKQLELDIGTDEGGKLKEAGTAHWNSPNEKATNEIGFWAIAGGDRNSIGNFINIGDAAYFWSSTDGGRDSARYRGLSHNAWDLTRGYGNGAAKQSGFSVRCVKD